MSDEVTLECPVCGEPTRFSMKRTAYKGGWCVGTGSGRHKARVYVEVESD